MKILVDLAIFQLQKAKPRGISRIWRSVLPVLFEIMPNDRFVLIHRTTDDYLDKINLPNVEHLQEFVTPYGSPIEPHKISDISRQTDADVFISTYYSYQYPVPSLMVVYDLIPEELGWDLTSLEWAMKAQAIERAFSLVCISKTTAKKLPEFYDVSDKSVSFGCCGFDRDVFHPATDREVETFRLSNNIAPPYFLMSGSRASYKNGETIYNAWQGGGDIVFLGGEASLPGEEKLRPIRLGWKGLDSVELRAAYTGAEALLWPSIMEGFGLPLIEAMACGCPIIASDIPINREICGDIATYVPPTDAMLWANAMESFRKPSRAQLAGRASRFTWDSIPSLIAKELRNVA